MSLLLFVFFVKKALNHESSIENLGNEKFLGVWVGISKTIKGKYKNQMSKANENNTEVVEQDPQKIR